MKHKAKKSDNSQKKITSSISHTNWTSLPTTIKWLQKQRKSFKTPNRIGNWLQRSRGVNATIIMLSASCLEGFFVECLESFVGPWEMYPNNTFQNRLTKDLGKRISVATFAQFPDLFKITLGQPLSESIEDLNEGIRVLIDFRNIVAHARSTTYQSFDPPYSENEDYEVEKQSRTIHSYLKKKKLITGTENLFTNEVADHFASLVKPYINEVLTLLPPVQSDNVIHLVNYAYQDDPEFDA